MIKEILETTDIGTAKSIRNLTVFPIITKNNRKRNDYITLDEALSRSLAHVTEVSEQGRVPELCFVNEAELSVFLLDGEELIGAKQNRVLNVSLLIPPQKSVPIPVSCVEQGRWVRQIDDHET